MVQQKLIIKAGEVRTLGGLILAVTSSLFLFSTLLFTNLLQMGSLILWPISKKAFRNFNTTCAGTWWGLCYFFQEKIYGIRTIFSGDEIPEKENAFVIVNHQAMADILVLFGLAIQKKRLGNLKFFVKDVLKYVPGLGWGMLFLDCLFLKRNWEKDQARIERTFGKFSRENIPLWLISFVEGTRLKPKKLEMSQAYAREKKLPVFHNVLLPRTKGFIAVVKNLRSHLHAVYDVTIVYPKGVPTLWQLVQGYVTEFHLDVKRFEVKHLPIEDAALSEWLLERFKEKDKLVEKFTDV